MGRNESQARNDKVAKEVAYKVAKNFGDKDPGKLAKQVKNTNTGRDTRR